MTERPETTRSRPGFEEPQRSEEGGGAARHQIARVRHETRRRRLTLSTKEMLTPRMLRLGFRSDALHDFDSPAPDDHIKLFFPPLGTLVIDVALHASGPAVEWAAAAAIGDRLEIGGPRGSTIVPDDFDWYLLIGDETALPAIGRRVEELRPGVPVATFAVVDSEAEIQHFRTEAAWQPTWVTRKAPADDAALLRAALAGYEFPPGEGFVWIAAEADVARDLRRLIVDERGHPRTWTKAAGYWKRGEADAHERIED